jgi:hypothetical protein
MQLDFVEGDEEEANDDNNNKANKRQPQALKRS